MDLFRARSIVEGFSGEENMEFKTIYSDGNVKIRTISQATIAKCPMFSFNPDHYKADGTCLCFDKDEQARIKKERAARRERTMAVVAKQRMK